VASLASRRRQGARGAVAQQVGAGGWRSMVVPAAAAARLREGGREEEQLRAGFHLPTGPAKPPGSGTGIPVQFGRKPVGTDQIQI